MALDALEVLTPRAAASWLPEEEDDDLSWVLPLADDLDADISSTSGASISVASPSSSVASSSFSIFDPESSSDAASSTSSPSPHIRTTTTRSKKKAPGRSARMPKLANSLTRTKHEIGTLREQAAELEGVLRRLKKAANRSRSHSPIGCDEALYGSDMQEMAMLWKGAAKHQRDLLKRAMRENQKLRLSVLDQKGLIKILQKMMLERALESAVLSEKLLPPSVDVDLSIDDRVMMTDLVADLTRMQLTPDASVEHRQKTAPDGGSFFNVEVCRDAVNGVTLEVLASEELPFGKAVVDRAIYSGLGTSTPGHRRFDPRLFGGTPTMGVVEELSNIVTPAGPEYYRHRRSVRTCSHDEHRSVSVSLGVIEPVDANGHPAPGLTFKAEMWIVRTQKTVVNEVTGVEEISTLLQNFQTISPVSVRGPYSLQWGEQVFEGVLSPLLLRAGLARLHRLENALMTR